MTETTQTAPVTAADKAALDALNVYQVALAAKVAAFTAYTKADRATSDARFADWTAAAKACAQAQATAAKAAKYAIRAGQDARIANK